jgi:hypothetical protein
MVWSCLPTWPLVLFGVIEPVLLYEEITSKIASVTNERRIWATITAFDDPTDYYVRQHYDEKLQQIPMTPQAHVMVLQTANIFVLLAGMAVACCWTPHADIAKKYLFIVAVADIGHILSVYKGFGDESFWKFSDWNDLVWGAVGVSVFLNINRWATLLGFFGRIEAKDRTSKRRD